MYQCPKCEKEFKDSAHLRRHVQRKTPCAPIIESPTKDDRACRYCGRSFASRPSMMRHVKQYCKIANSEEGMEKLFEHALKRQTHEMAEIRTENAKMRDQVGRLTELLERQLALSPLGGAGPLQSSETRIKHVTQVNANTVTNVSANTINVINVRPWDGERRIDVSTAQIAAAFAENARLKEYVQLEEHQLTDPEIAPPYVTELLMDLTKRAHADPTARNVYLNPRRADQALVHMTNGRWEVMPLTEATRLIFDGVAKAMVRVTMSNEERRQLPLEAQNALAMAGLLYDDEPEEYAKRAKAPMAAHLTNCRDSAAQIGQ